MANSSWYLPVLATITTVCATDQRVYVTVETSTQTCGKDIVLRCTFMETFSEDSRRAWEKDGEVILLDGIATDSKYTEDISNAASRYFELTIKDFTSSDIGTYRCDYGFNTGFCQVTCIGTVTVLTSPGQEQKECDDNKYGDNCSENCTCVVENTLVCNPVTGFCSCKAGWTGIDCGRDINECDQNVCPDNSICSNTDGSFICQSNHGFMEASSASCPAELSSMIPLSLIFFLIYL